MSVDTKYLRWIVADLLGTPKAAHTAAPTVVGAIYEGIGIEWEVAK